MRFLKQNDGRPTLTMCTCGTVHFSYGSITYILRPRSTFLSQAPWPICLHNTSTPTAIDGLARSHQSRSYLPLIQEPVHEDV